MTKLLDLVRVYDGALDGALCDRIVEGFEADSENHTGPGGIAAGSRHSDQESKWTELNIERLESWRDIHQTLIGETQKFGSKYSEDCDIWFPPRCRLEDFRIKRYAPGGEDQFALHVDSDCLANAKRFLVFFWYLADVADGGETCFPDLDRTVKPAKGRLLMFPPFWMYPHLANPPLSGPKYILGTYLTYTV